MRPTANLGASLLHGRRLFREKHHGQACSSRHASFRGGQGASSCELRESRFSGYVSRPQMMARLKQQHVCPSKRSQILHVATCQKLAKKLLKSPFFHTTSPNAPTKAGSTSATSHERRPHAFRKTGRSLSQDLL